MTRAADELGRTQSAVSRQIANLEQFARRPLFTRDRKRLIVNEAGAMFHEALTRILNDLETEVGRLVTYGVHDRLLRVGVLPTFGSRWLVSRLGEFAIANEGIAISLVTGLGPFDLEKAGLDVAIQYGDGNWGDVESFLLQREEIVAVAAPHVVRPDATISDYLRLDMTTRPFLWSTWLEARNGGCPVGERTTQFENFNMVIEAAASGMGVAMLPTFYIRDELASGRLVAPFGPPLSSGRGYYFIQRRADRQSRKIDAFRRWLLSIVREDDDDTGDIA